MNTKTMRASGVGGLFVLVAAVDNRGRIRTAACADDHVAVEIAEGEAGAGTGAGMRVVDPALLEMVVDAQSDAHSLPRRTSPLRTHRWRRGSDGADEARAGRPGHSGPFPDAGGEEMVGPGEFEPEAIPDGHDETRTPSAEDTPTPGSEEATPTDGSDEDTDTDEADDGDESLPFTGGNAFLRDRRAADCCGWWHRPDREAGCVPPLVGWLRRAGPKGLARSAPPVHAGVQRKE